MVVKIGINGFGRIGRVVFRTCLENPYLKITAINDPAINAEYICYLIKFDSTHGKFNGNVTHTTNQITVDGASIKVFHEKSPSNVPWQTADVQYVVEASGMFTNLEKASGHLANDSVKRVIITAPSVDVPMVIFGVNHSKLHSDQKVISCGSSTLYCLAPIVKILEDNYGIDEGFVTSIHAMTPSLKPLDGLCLKGKHWRDHRSIHQNIIPAVTGACRALGKIIPQVKGKLSGMAFRVPIVNVSVLDISVRLIENTSLRDIVSVIDELSASTMETLIKTTKEEAVSSDFIGDSHSCILDVTSSLQLKPNFFKLVCWYENEFSYACRVVDSIMFSETQLRLIESPLKMTYVRSKTSKKRDMMQQTEYCTNKTDHNDDGENLESCNIFRQSPDIEGNAKPIRYINIDSCVQIMPNIKKQTTDSKAEQHLEKVKKEFTKMLNITKDLLKKSNSSKLHTSLCNKSLKRDKIDTIKTNSDKKSYKIALKSSIFKLSDDFEPCLGTFPVNSSLFDTSGKEYADRLNKHLTSDLNDNNNKTSKDNRELHCPNVVFKKQGIQTINTLVGGHAQSINVYTATNQSNNLNRHREKKINQLDNVKKLNKTFTDNDSGFTSPSIKLSSEMDDTINQYTSKDFDNTITEENLQMKITYSYPIVTELKHTVDIPALADMHKDGMLETFNIKSNNKTALPRNILDRLSKYIPDTAVVSDNRPKYSSSHVTKINGEKNRKQDIYDKLDSTSATDSDNSFQINKRKSQVIHISDVTNSLEDLARLDKICKIIEISDELSDKLFSSLNTAENTEYKKWSFRDLCERIKLDEFCNKIFGK